ncbi:UDP-glycosyltransferase UGT5-like isoform X1 [Periplaneta americana]|uniref:UDP-glycosyltransferase UGT5-like isoform X1 n=2 Tax=Periplaneta americana TaxID=6978 RepID=UPI0037E83E1C
MHKLSLRVEGEREAGCNHEEVRMFKSTTQVCLLVLTSLLLVLQSVSSARFLVIYHSKVRSRFSMVEPYMKALASRGHQVVVVGYYPQKQPIPNFTDVTVEEVAGGLNPGAGVSVDTASEYFNPVTNVIRLAEFGVHSCKAVLSHPEFVKLIKSNQKFDAVIYDLLHTDCFLPLATKYGAVSIGVSPTVLMPWANDPMGNPDNPSYIPNLFSRYSDQMNFIARTVNSVTMVLFKVIYYFKSYRPSQEVARQHFGQDVPELDVLARNMSLVLVNSHFSLNSPRPLVPGVVEVSGMHIPPPQQLPKHIQEYLDSAEHGVIYFSFGSVIQAKTLPADKRDAFLQAFAELPQKVLWKWEGESLPGQTKNVHIEKWCPQADILRHPNVVAFLSHGGLMGTLEALNGGVPIVGIPFFADQRTNLANLVAKGMAVKLDYEEITKQNVLNALRTVLEQPSYMENARHTAQIFRDRPLSALDTAIFWTEYVLRHKGAPHLRSAAVDLTWYQYLLLDVIAFIAAIILLFLLAVRKLITLMFGSKKTTQKKKKVN